MMLENKLMERLNLRELNRKQLELLWLYQFKVKEINKRITKTIFIAWILNFIAIVSDSIIFYVAIVVSALAVFSILSVSFIKKRTLYKKLESELLKAKEKEEC